VAGPYDLFFCVREYFFEPGSDDAVYPFLLETCSFSSADTGNADIGANVRGQATFW